MDELKVELYSMTGLKLLDQNIEHKLGRHQVELDMRDIQGGVYFLRLTNGRMSISDNIKIIKK